MNTIDDIKKEHDVMREILNLVIPYPNHKTPNAISNTLDTLLRLRKVWNVHEKNEELFFKNLSSNTKFPVKRMDVAHRELKGHWKVLMNAFDSGDDLKITLALDTDGKMLVNKLMKHMEYEEFLFEKYFITPYSNLVKIRVPEFIRN